MLYNCLGRLGCKFYMSYKLVNNRGVENGEVKFGSIRKLISSELSHYGYRCVFGFVIKLLSD